VKKCGLSENDKNRRRTEQNRTKKLKDKRKNERKEER
jgi:hypothetical protein